MATQLKFISAYGPKTKYRTSMDGQETRTHQSGKDECDINKIMDKYVKTGTLDHQKEHGENYGFATSIDLHQALSTIELANSMFNDLPSSIRTKFENDPGKFLDFVQDPSNKTELIKMGLSNDVEETGSETIPAPPEVTEPEPVTETEKAPE